jgi:hypothetical protein
MVHPYMDDSIRYRIKTDCAPTNDEVARTKASA